MMRGDLVGAAAQFGELVAEAEAADDVLWRVHGLFGQGYALAYQGDTSAARAAADAAIEAAAELGGFVEGSCYAALALAALAAGDVAAASDASEVAWQRLSVQPTVAAVYVYPVAQTALARGDLAAARRRADEAVSATTGWHLSTALMTRARVAIAQGESEQAERDAHDALAVAADVQAYLAVPDILECLADPSWQMPAAHREAARLFGAAEAIRQRHRAVRFKLYDADYQAAVAALRNAMGEQDFAARGPRAPRCPSKKRSPTPNAAAANANARPAGGPRSPPPSAMSCDSSAKGWRTRTSPRGFSFTAHGADPPKKERKGGERKRPASGWASLTPTERDVVRLVSEGLANKDIATRLFVSPRTVQTHLTHVYTKLGITSRVQLAQEAARHP